MSLLLVLLNFHGLWTSVLTLRFWLINQATLDNIDQRVDDFLAACVFPLRINSAIMWVATSVLEVIMA